MQLTVSVFSSCSLIWPAHPGGSGHAIRSHSLMPSLSRPVQLASAAPPVTATENPAPTKGAGGSLEANASRSRARPSPPAIPNSPAARGLFSATAIKNDDRSDFLRLLLTPGGRAQGGGWGFHGHEPGH